MSKIDKLIQKIYSDTAISYDEIERILLKLGYKLTVKGSHHTFRKTGNLSITMKKRKRLLGYQVKEIKEALKDHGY